MDNAVNTPVVETPPSEVKADACQAEAKQESKPKASPAQELRDIQYLLLNGIFPGNVAPAVVKAYQLLDKMAVQVEASVESK